MHLTDDIQDALDLYETDDTQYGVSKLPTAKARGLSPSRFQAGTSVRHEAARTEEFGRTYFRLQGGTCSPDSPTKESVPSILYPMQRRNGCCLRQRAIPPKLESLGFSHAARDEAEAEHAVQVLRWSLTSPEELARHLAHA